MKLTFGAATAALVVGAGVLGTGVAAARPVSLTLHYTCDFPAIGGQHVTVQVNADVPDSHTVGRPTEPFPITVMATVSDLFTWGLNFLGVHSVEGTADGDVKVAAPQGNFSVSIPFTIPNTTVPASGSFRVPVTGSAPSLRFTRAGNGEITAGNINLHLAARDANGNPTLGKLDLPCTLDSGQNDVIESFDVRPQPSATATTGRAVSGAGGNGAKEGSAATNGPGPAAPGNTGTSTGDSSTTAGTGSTGTGSTGTPSTGSASATTAKPTTTPAADGASLNATGGGAGNTSTPILLTLGGCVAAIGAVGYGGSLWRRRHTGSEGILTVSRLEEVPEQDQRRQAPPVDPRS